jgi:DnaA family protein
MEEKVSGNMSQSEYNNRITGIINISMMKNQLPLSFKTSEESSFDNFIPGKNQLLVDCLLSELEPLVFIWGETGSGKSHLLQAITAHYNNHNKQALYIPLVSLTELEPEIFTGLEQLDLICLDDIQALAEKANWEEALFHLFNRMRDSQKRLIVSADNSARHLSIQLPDLRSRLAWGITYQLMPLQDDEKIMALKVRADERGFKMNDEVAQYLLNHTARDMKNLMTLLEKLDYASLAEQRKLTIPFVKQLIGTR